MCPRPLNWGAEKSSDLEQIRNLRHVAQVVEQQRSAVAVEVGAGVMAGGHAHGPRADAAPAVQVVRGISNDPHPLAVEPVRRDGVGTFERDAGQIRAVAAVGAEPAEQTFGVHKRRGEADEVELGEGHPFDVAGDEAEQHIVTPGKRGHGLGYARQHGDACGGEAREHRLGVGVEERREFGVDLVAVVPGER